MRLRKRVAEIEVKSDCAQTISSSSHSTFTLKMVIAMYVEFSYQARTAKTYGQNFLMLSLCLIKYHAMKTYGERRYSSTNLDHGTRRR
jgi:hypothetical protein